MRTPAVSLLAVALLVAACADSRRPAIPTAIDIEATAAQAASFSGAATVVQASGLTSTTLGHAGPLPAEGGAEEASLLNASIPGLLTATAVHAATVGQGDASRSEASLANLDLSVTGISVTASFAMARAAAACTGGLPTASGSAEVVGLTVNGQAITVSQPNQTITVPLVGRVVINEQMSSGGGDVTINAIHVIANGVADVVVGSAYVDISCTEAFGMAGVAGGAGGEECTDKVTGGGWITGTPSGARANFGVAGGIKHDAFWGHLTYNDHGPGGPRVKGTGVTAYVFVDATTRHIEGTAEIDGVDGTYAVDVADNGEPGRNDTFTISLSTGYSATGTLRGGNIQLHKPCPEDPGDPT